MDIISRDELKAKLERHEDFKLVTPLDEWAFNAKHIPGSIRIDLSTSFTHALDPTSDIVIYCADEFCPASKYAYMLLEKAGYPNIRRYAGGIAEWEASGYPIEGEWVKQPVSV